MESKKNKTRAIVAGAAVIVAAAVAMANPNGGKKEIDPPVPVPAPAPAPAPQPAAPQPIAIPTPPPAPQPQTPVPQPQPPKPRARPKVEVVFALDTTGSMTGLIAGAKAKIWSIANHIASGQPTPEVKIGLVAYRDIGDVYVTKDFPLSGDLDAVFEHLQSFQASGGGDDPEHVNKALFDAVHNMQWSKDAMKMVFLVGDAPPHMDYNDGYDYHKIAREAAKEEISISAIRCGQNPDTAAAWREIASLGHGTFATIEQDGGVATIATPMDADLARLGRELDETAIVYGRNEARRAYAAKSSAAAGAPAPSAADRSGYYAKTHAALDKDDVVGGTVDVTKLDDDLLPEDLRGKTGEERKEMVAEKQKTRERVMKEMGDLSAKREQYLRDANTKNTKAGAKADGFDAVVDETITKQAQDYGLKY